MTTTEMAATYELAQAMVAWGEAMAAMVRAHDVTVLDAICAGRDVSDSRRESLSVALSLGADDATLARLRDAGRVSRTSTIVLPSGRYERLSRGRGWARHGRGATAEWGEQVDGGYRVGAGKWSVGSTDGFSRKSDESWVVQHVLVGGQTWTVAS